MGAPSREQLLHALYEAAELEHTLMCTYLYAAFSLRSGVEEGLSPAEAEAVERWRRTLLKISVEEMGHLTAVWNITSALGGSPRFGRGNFPLEPGALPASVVVKLVPFGEAALQHFVHLERPADSLEPEGAGFQPDLAYRRAVAQPRLVPMSPDYETVGAFYATLGDDLRAFVARVGEAAAFSGDPALQISVAEVPEVGTRPVICLPTALAAFSAIVEQGEGAPGDSAGSHFRRFHDVRDELAALRAQNPAFAPAHPAAHSPVLRPPMRPEGRVWIEDETAAQVVDLANAGYGLMLRLLAYPYRVPAPAPERQLAIDLSLGLMRAITPIAEHAARLPAGPSNPGCHAGMSFTALRDSSPLPPGPGARRFFIERLEQMYELAGALSPGAPRVLQAARLLGDLAARARAGFAAAAAAVPAATPAPAPAPAPAAAAAAAPPASTTQGGVERAEGTRLAVLFEGKRCIHARFCVTGAPTVFLANVQGPWIHPDTVAAERVVEIAHACPSGAIRYRRKDGQPDEGPPPVNLIAIRERGPYAVRADIQIDGVADGYRATLCRCGGSKNKPYCDGTHKEIDFAATGEPPTQSTEMLEVRDGPLAIAPQLDGPLVVRGNVEITSGTGRVVARTTGAKLCRCGASATKPFCDDSHRRVGFRSDR